MGIISCKPCETQENEGDRLIDVGKYHKLVGKLIYLPSTRPDISYPIGITRQSMHAPTPTHLETTY